MNLKKSINFAKEINKKLRIKPRYDEYNRFHVRRYNTLLRIYKYINENHFLMYAQCNIKHCSRSNNGKGHFFYDLYNRDNDIFITYYT
jgi:hypothetical protein